MTAPAVFLRLKEMNMNYADSVDEAAALQEMMVANALANRQMQPSMVYTGECHWCETPIDTGHFCDAECREDHERIERAKQHRRVA